MPTFLNHVIHKITTNIDGVKAVVLSGSHQNESIVDMWSDTDLLVILHPRFIPEKEQFMQAIEQIGLVLGYEFYQRSEQSIAYQTAIQFEASIQLLDVQISSYYDWIMTESVKNQSYTLVYGEVEMSDKSNTKIGIYSFDSYESNNIWFMYFIAIKKFARNDNVIGLHLLLDLIREYLVVEMIERDIRYGTNIHRFGYGEQLPKTIQLSSVDLSDKTKIFEFIKSLAYEYDQKLVNHISGYKSRYEQVAIHIEKSKKYIVQ